MIRLSQRGWNNVIIVSMLFMILLFNGVHNRLFEQDSEERVSVLPYRASILTMEIANQVTIVRIGRGWQVTGTQLSDDSLTAMMSTWHALQGQSAAPMQADKAGYLLTLELAGVATPLVLELIQSDTLWVRDITEERWINVHPVTIDQLLPASVLKDHE